ncbi:chorismate-binding protein [Cystobacter ferrugineus]|uniref:chorismate-binding protein n=1 Tax=Cystobacter ferrugineus TaxID=83449 RepID=UPI000A033065|nr:chorismate-binding protein [Cystobacter ferrugineus]
MAHRHGQRPLCRPERLVRVEDGWAITRPIAGTRRKGTPEENARFAHELRTSEYQETLHKARSLLLALSVCPVEDAA